jgi:hypothetical protein
MVNRTNARQVEPKPQTVPSVRIEAGRVLVRLELASVANVGYIQDIELVLTPKNAAELGAELTIAIQRLAK